MDFKVLGALQVDGPDGNRIKLASDAQRRLTSLLVLHANTAVRSEALEDQLGLSAGALRTSICRLRRVVGFDVLVTEAPGYELRTTRVDALRFEGLLEAARAADPHTARTALVEALALWRGEPYEEFSHEPWAQAEARRLGELRAGAVEDLVQLDLAERRFAPAIARLDALIDEHPFWDRPRALLLQALEGAGRRADALREFQRYRTLLLDEVGTEPSPELVALDRQIATR